MSEFGPRLRRAALLCAAASLVALAVPGPAARAQTAPAASEGPGRIICRTAATCELGIGTPPKLKFRVDASALPDADKARLTKQCTAKGTPCVATVKGEEAATGNSIKASAIQWFN